MRKMILLAAEALAALGLNRISIDLTLPTLAPMLLDDACLAGPARTALTHALDRKDTAVVTRHGGPIAGLLTELLLAAGPVGPAMEVLDRAELGPGPAALRTAPAGGGGGRARAGAGSAADARSAGVPRLPLPHRHLPDGVFGHPRRGAGPRRPLPLRRGAGHRAQPVSGRDLARLPAAAGPPARGSCPGARRRSWAPAWRSEGYATVGALAESADPAGEAARLGCTHIARDGVAAALNAEA